jgi:hypothetical protein
VRPVVGASSSPDSGSAVRDPHVRAIIVRYPSFSCKSLRGSAWHQSTRTARDVPLPGSPERVHLSLSCGEMGSPSSPLDTCGSPQPLRRARTLCSPGALRALTLHSSWTTRPRVPTGETGAYLRETGARTYGRSAAYLREKCRVPTGEVPRTYGRSAAYLREKCRVPTGEIT